MIARRSAVPHSRPRIAAEPVSDVGHHCRRQQRRAGRYGAVLVDTEVSAGAIEVDWQADGERQRVGSIRFSRRRLAGWWVILFGGLPHPIAVAEQVADLVAVHLVEALGRLVIVALSP